MRAAGGAWSNGWTVTYTDEGGNVVPVRVQEAVPNVAIAGPVGDVVYQGSGRLTGAVSFQLSSSGDTVVTRCIRVDLSGRPHTKAATC
jgi:hypothetical protein